jgi:cell division transport system ATP-binding protein
MIALKRVTKTYGRTKVLHDVSFRIDPHEFVCVTGPSGAGKTTLLLLLIGAEHVTSGSIEVDGVDLRAVPPPVLQLYRRRIGMVFQDGKLLGNRTVAENIAFPLEVCGAPDAVIRKRVPELLKLVGLTGHTNAFPRELSAGEKARTAIARAIAHKPMILLADEPTGNIDPKQSREILELFREINREGTTVVLATHDTTLVDVLQTRVIRLEAGKVTRDSRGGYEHPKAHAHMPQSKEEKHDIFDEGGGHEADTAVKRKIRVTAIHS